MKHTLLFSLLLTFGLVACKKNKGTVQQTYNKAFAQYENINNIRKTSINGTIRGIYKTGKIFFGSRMILIGEVNEGIHVIDNSNPSSPINVSFIDLPYTNEFYVENNIIYAVSHYDLIKIDVTDLTQPILIDRLENAFGQNITDGQGNVLVGFKYERVTESFELGSPEELALRENNTLYYDFQNEVIPFSDVPSSFIGSSVKNKGTINRIAIDNSNIYILGRREIHTFYDNGSQLSKASKNEVGDELETIYTKGDKIFVGSSSEMIVLTKTSSPQKVSSYQHTVTCDPVLPHGNIAYLTLRSVNTNGCNGDVNVLDVIDISNISNPTKIKEIQLSSPYGMAIVNNYLFVAESNNGLTVLDISNPADPIKLITHSTIRAFDVLMHPTASNTILTTGHNGIKQFSFNPSNQSLQELSEILAP